MARATTILTRAAALAIAALAATAQESPAPMPSDQGPIVLDQGWSGEVRDRFYFTPEGSWMMPYDWFVALERADGAGRFADPGYLRAFGLLPPDGPSAANPDGFPIGLAVGPGLLDQGPFEASLDAAMAGDRQVGLTCAACHTADVTVDGARLRIDGGPARFDLDRFYAALSQAVTATLRDEARFGRFAAAVVDPASPTEVAELRLRFAAYQVRLTGDAALRRPVVASGYGRADALTQIVNSLAVRDQERPANLYPVAAPVSFPQLWLAPRLEFVQWNPIAASPIGRNAGQVLGVFGRDELQPSATRPFRSTVLLSEIHAIEGWLAELKPPAWDEALMGPIDRPLAATGAALFTEHCAACHNMAPYRETDPADNFFGATFIEIGRVDYREVGTDPAYVEALAGRLVETNPVTAPLFGGQAVVPAAAFFLRTVGATVEAAMAEANLPDAERAAYSGYRFRTGPDGRPTPYVAPSFTDLKAGPLAGAWATGPYLHNGSVPTIYELLSPPAERRAVFWTGGIELDRERLGLLSEEGPAGFRFDTSLAGNGNGGHAYPARGLGPEERMAIIEYLKTQ